jgi:anti-sigma factor RsiW
MMNCTEADYYLPLYWSGELDARTMADLELHLAACPACEREAESQKTCDQMLRDVFDAQQIDAQALRNNVRRRIRVSRGWRRLLWQPAFRLAAAAALIVIALGAGLLYVATRRAPAPLSAAAARDHLDDVVKQVPKSGWLRSPAEGAAFMQEHFDAPRLVHDLAPANYSFARVRMCNLGGEHFAHLVYERGGHEISYFVRHRGGTLPGVVAETVNDRALHHDRAGGFEITAFQSERLKVLIVGDMPQTEIIYLARDAALRIA